MRILPPRLTIVFGILAVSLILAANRVVAQPAVGPLEPPPSAEEPQSQEVKDAIAAFQRRDVAEAFAKLQEAVAKDPTLPPARIMLFRLFRGIPQGAGMRQARLSLELAVLETPDDPEAYILLGTFALNEGRPTEAKLLFNRASELMATFQGNAERKKALQPQIHAGLASVSMSRARIVQTQAERDALLGTAKGHLEAWEKADPENAQAKWQLGNALFALRLPNEALEKFREAYTQITEAGGKSRHWATQMAFLYFNYPEEESAKEWINYALQVDADSLDTQLVAAQLYLNLGDLEKAKEHATSAIQKAAELDNVQASLTAKILRGYVSMYQEDYVSAERYFDAARDQSPISFQATNNLALALCEQPESEPQRRAVEFAAANWQMHSRDRLAATAASTLGWVYYKTGQLQRAAQMLTTALQTGDRSPDTRYFMARVQVDLDPVKNRAEAINLLNNALKSTRPFWKKKNAEALLAQLER